MSLSRRSFLASACCLAAAPVFTPISFAAMPGDNRFVTIVLRGAMDGLDLVQPYGDASLRDCDRISPSGRTRAFSTSTAFSGFIPQPPG